MCVIFLIWFFVFFASIMFLSCYSFLLHSLQAFKFVFMPWHASQCSVFYISIFILFWNRSMVHLKKKKRMCNNNLLFTMAIFVSLHKYVFLMHDSLLSWKYLLPYSTNCNQRYFWSTIQTFSSKCQSELRSAVTLI